MLDIFSKDQIFDDRCDDNKIVWKLCVVAFYIDYNVDKYLVK